MSGERSAPDRRNRYKIFTSISTRWRDNDVYGHVNNVVFYEWFDTAVNGALIRMGLIDPQKSPVIGLVVETSCTYFAPVSFPQAITAGIAVTRLGGSSAEYAVGIFAGEGETAAAQGRFVHVYVDRGNRRPTPLPDALRRGLETLLRSGS